MRSLTSLIIENKLDSSQSDFGTDKGSTHTYAQNLYPIIFDVLEPVRSILEIGVWRGASCALWKLVFPEAMVVGVDISIGELHPCAQEMLNEDQIQVIEADAYSEDFLDKIQTKFDLIIDDGPHTISTQIEALNFRKLLSPKGILVIEDIQDGPSDYLKIRRCLPKHLRKNIIFLSFVHLSHRYDDAVIIYSEDVTTIECFSECGNDIKQWVMKKRIPFNLLMVWIKVKKKLQGFVKKRDHYLPRLSKRS